MVVQGIAGPKLVTWCGKCKTVLSMDPHTTRDYQAEMRERCRQDARDAGPAKPCKCGDLQVLCGRSQFCGTCHAHATIRLLAEVPVHRLGRIGL